MELRNKPGSLAAVCRDDTYSDNEGTNVWCRQLFIEPGTAIAGGQTFQVEAKQLPCWLVQANADGLIRPAAKGHFTLAEWAIVRDSDLRPAASVIDLVAAAEFATTLITEEITLEPPAHRPGWH